MKNEIRSEYIKDLLAEKDSLKKKLEESTKDNLREILSETVQETMRNMISEADKDSYEEEEVDTDSTDDVLDDKIKTDEVDEPADADTEDESDEEVSDIEGDDEMWDDLEQYKDADGDYDLTGMDSDNVIKVLKIMKPEDGVKVIKNDNGTITLSDEETDKEYVIDFDGGVDFNDDMATEGVNEDLGYTTDYQSDTAMTTPSNRETANPRNTYSMDDGVPTGVEKPWPGKSGNMKPFGDNVNENDDCEVEVEMGDDDQVEEATNVGGFVQQNSTSKSHVPNSDGRSARNQSKGGEYSSTQNPRYTGTQMENIMRKANAIFNENKQLKGIISQLRTQINEAIVLNYSLSKVTKLVTENSTSKDEKVDIIHRFNEARTINEAKELYQKIDNELKNINRINSINKIVDGQLAESKNNIVETPMYQSDDLTETLSLMYRMENIK